MCRDVYTLLHTGPLYTTSTWATPNTWGEACNRRNLLAQGRHVPLATPNARGESCNGVHLPITPYHPRPCNPQRMGRVLQPELTFGAVIAVVLATPNAWGESCNPHIVRNGPAYALACNPQRMGRVLQRGGTARGARRRPLATPNAWGESCNAKFRLDSLVQVSQLATPNAWGESCNRSGVAHGGREGGACNPQRMGRVLQPRTGTPTMHRLAACNPQRMGRVLQPTKSVTLLKKRLLATPNAWGESCNAAPYLSLWFADGTLQPPTHGESPATRMSPVSMCISEPSLQPPTHGESPATSKLSVIDRSPTPSACNPQRMGRVLQRSTRRRCQRRSRPCNPQRMGRVLQHPDLDVKVGFMQGLQPPTHGESPATPTR